MGVDETRDVKESQVPETKPEKLSPTGQQAMQGEGDDVDQSQIPPATVAGSERKPLNYDEYANRTYHFENQKQCEKLKQKYPDGIKYDAEGYPDFSPHALKSVEIDMKGNYTTDYAKANAAAGYSETPDNYTWHHHQDKKTMQLVPTDLHRNVPHTGGVSLKKSETS